MKQKNRQSPWGLVFILVGAGIISAFQVGKVPPLLPDIRAEFGISFFYAGWILSVFNIIGLMLGTCTGAIADTVGHRRLLITGIILQAFGSFLGSFATTLPFLLTTRFIEGAGFLSVIVSTPTLIFQVVKEKDAKVALSIWSCYLPAGASLIMVLIPIIMNHAEWRSVWQINSIMLTIYALILLKATTNLPSFQKNNLLNANRLAKDVIITATSIGPLLLALIFTTYALQWLAIMGFLPTLLIEKFEFSKSTGSLLTALMVAVNIIGNLAGGWLLQKGAKRWSLIAFASAVMGGCAIAIYTPGFGFAVNYTGCILFSLFGGLIPASVIGGAPVYAPSQKLISTTVGIIIQGGQTGQFFGPVILAWLISTTGTWETGSWLLASVAFLGVIFSIGLSKLQKFE